MLRLHRGKARLQLFDFGARVAVVCPDGGLCPALGRVYHAVEDLVTVSVNQFEHLPVEQEAGKKRLFRALGPLLGVGQQDSH